MRHEHHVSTICRVIELSERTYYASLKRKQSDRDLLNQKLRCAILNIYIAADKRFGAYKINNSLRKQGFNISMGKLYRLLSTIDLPTIFNKKPKYKYVKDDNDIKFTNVLKRNFNVDAPNKAWVTDFTYIKVNSKFCYVCVIIDLFARKVIAYACSNKIDTTLALRTLDIAMQVRNYPKNVIFHSDRGCQYTAKAFRKKIDHYNMIQSFSKPGCPYDNAVAESFFRYFKQGELNRRTYRTLQDLELSTFNYIENYYNNLNPHSHNNGLTPNKTEQIYFSNID